MKRKPSGHLALLYALCSAGRTFYIFYNDTTDRSQYTDVCTDLAGDGDEELSEVGAAGGQQGAVGLDQSEVSI